MTTAKTLRVLSYNIHKGFSFGSRKFVLNWIRDSIREVGAELCLLQEVVGYHEIHPTRISHYPTTSQFEFLADGVWSHFTYGKNAIYTQGHHGNAILSKYPIESSNNLDISTNLFEKRGLLHAKLQVPGKGYVHVMTSHLSLLERSRKQQIALICDYIEQTVPQGEKIIFAGDFNDWRQKTSRHLHLSAALKEAYRSVHGHYARSFPSIFPVLALDRIYFRGFTVTDARRLEGGLFKALSDHLALFAEFEF
jgi:endonuclease/exonuclease/phosphatase family metal-dependent hydrolase